MNGPSLVLHLVFLTTITAVCQGKEVKLIPFDKDD